MNLIMSISGTSRDAIAAPPLRYEDTLSDEPLSLELIGESAATRHLKLQIDRIGPHFRMLLVHGEIGSGKELVARSLHKRRGEGEESFFICYGAALAEPVDEGRIDAPGSPWHTLIRGTHGTIFVDGVDQMNLRSQSRLLELIDGWTRSRARTRMIAATAQDLKKMMGAGRFRSDLFHRLATIEIAIEPLRRRREDIPALAAHFLARFVALYGKRIISIEERALQKLKSYDWPGNVREFENAIRNAVLRCEEDILKEKYLGQMPQVKKTLIDPESGSGEYRIENLQTVVDRHVMRILELCGGNKVRAAELLGISRSTLYRMLEGVAVTNGRVA